jgi:hypothetical protein
MEIEERPSFARKRAREEDLQWRFQIRLSNFCPVWCSGLDGRYEEPGFTGAVRFASDDRVKVEVDRTRAKGKIPFVVCEAVQRPVERRRESSQSPPPVQECLDSSNGLIAACRAAADRVNKAATRCMLSGEMDVELARDALLDLKVRVHLLLQRMLETFSDIGRWVVAVQGILRILDLANLEGSDELDDDEVRGKRQMAQLLDAVRNNMVQNRRKVSAEGSQGDAPVMATGAPVSLSPAEAGAAGLGDVFGKSEKLTASECIVWLLDVCTEQLDERIASVLLFRSDVHDVEEACKKMLNEMSWVDHCMDVVERRLMEVRHSVQQTQALAEAAMDVAEMEEKEGESGGNKVGEDDDVDGCSKHGDNDDSDRGDESDPMRRTLAKTKWLLDRMDLLF